MSLVAFLPGEPHPRVSDGARFVVPPIAPWVDGVFTRIRETGLCRANCFIISSFFEWIARECPPIPP